MEPRLILGSKEDVPAVTAFRNDEADYSDYVSKTSTREEGIVFKKYGNSSENAYFVIKDGDKIIGNCVLLIHHGEAHIARVSVSRHCRGMGLGKRLIEACLARCRGLSIRKCHLLINPLNINAKGLYEKLGFVLIDRPYNLDGINLYKMTCLV